MHTQDIIHNAHSIATYINTYVHPYICIPVQYASMYTCIIYVYKYCRYECMHMIVVTQA